MKFETTAGTFSAAVSSVIAATGRDGVMSHIGITGASDFAQLSACNGELALILITDESSTRHVVMPMRL